MHGKPLRDDPFADEGAFALLSLDIALSGEFQNSKLDRCLAHFVDFAELIFRGYLGAYRQLSAIYLCLQDRIKLYV